MSTKVVNILLTKCYTISRDLECESSNKSPNRHIHIEIITFQNKGGRKGAELQNVNSNISTTKNYPKNKSTLEHNELNEFEL